MDVYMEYGSRVGKRSLLQTQLDAANFKISGLAQQHLDLIKALQVMEEASASLRGTIETQVTNLLTGAMVDVFGEGVGCQLKYRQLPSGLYKPEFEAWDATGVSGDPVAVFGGSAVEIICLALRIFFLIQSEQPRLLVLDEPLRGVDSTNVYEVAVWLRAICHELQIQLIMVSHVGEGVYEGVADKILLVEKKGTKSNVTEV